MSRMIKTTIAATLALANLAACKPATEQAQYASARPAKVADARLYNIGEVVPGANYSIVVSKAYTADRVGSDKAVMEPPKGSRMIVVEYEITNTGPLPYHGHDVPSLSLRVGADGFYGESAAPRFFFSEKELKDNRYAEEFRVGEKRRGVLITFVPMRSDVSGDIVVETTEGRKIGLPKAILDLPAKAAN